VRLSSYPPGKVSIFLFKFPAIDRRLIASPAARNMQLETRKSDTGFVLDGLSGCGWMALMKMKFPIYAALLSLAILAAGCVDTVTGRKTAAVPFIVDTKESLYERPLSDVFRAAKEVIAFNGTLVHEGDYHPPGETNSPARIIKTVEGKVNQRTVWVRIEQVDSKTTGVAVQTRTQAGVPDRDLAAELDKQIALKLVR
jgi:hypothetical protein